VCSEKEIAEIYRRAAEAKRLSEGSVNPIEKSELRDVERRWLTLAWNCKCNSEKARKPARRRPHTPRRKPR
jgi:hypothetical protein